jgi:hypothetical protein
MAKQIYIHKKTGNPYSLITDNFMFKDNGEWRRGLCLYKTEYENPDGEYFARTKEDFYSSFEKGPSLDFETHDEYVGYIKYKMKKDVNDFMKKYEIGIGSSFFADILREIADTVDD